MADLTAEQGDELLEVFDTLTSPILVCDAEGRVMFCNMAASKVLGCSSREVVGHVRLVLDDRDTLSAMSLGRLGPRGRGGRRVIEFFLSDLIFDGLDVKGLSASLASLDSGGYRVQLVESVVEESSPLTRLFSSLSGVMEHVGLFSAFQEVLPLFGSCLDDIFVGCTARLELWRGGDLVAEWERGDVQRGRVRQGDGPRAVSVNKKATGRGGKEGVWLLEEDDFLWTQSLAGIAVWGGWPGGMRCGLQLESWRSNALEVEQREAARLFVHVLSFFVERLVGDASGEGFAILAPVLDQLDAAVALCDARRLVRSCNLSFSNVLGKGMSELVGQDVVQFFEDEVRGELRSAAAQVLSGGEHLEVMTVAAPGTELDVNVRVLPLQGGAAQERGFMILMQPSMESLDSAIHKAERAEHLLQVGQLASGVAHELKNPMTSILNYAEYLLQKYRDQFFEQRDSERLVRIIEGVERMDLFIRDLMLLARPDVDGSHSEKVSIGTVLKQASYLCAVQLEQQGVSMQMELPEEKVLVYGNSGQLTQVFVNVLSNAIASLEGREGGEIHVRLLCAPAGFICCEIEDNGCGMDAETLSRIFEPFYTRRRHRGGSGLGLPLVRSIVERHGGEVEIMSGEGSGTLVRVLLPQIDEVM